MSDSRVSKVSLVTGYENVVPDLIRRLVLVILLIAFVTLVLWLDREGLRDNAHPGKPISFIDVFYFTVVTITTVGYGDIIPVSQRARLIGTLLVTPIRIIVFIIFIGTAYQLVIQRYKEAYLMSKVRARLKDHIILCGYGVKGHATANELLSFGWKAEDIAVIDPEQAAVEDAAREGFASFRGDATAEATLKAAAIDKALHVIVDVDRDDTTVLICLTVKHVNPKVCISAAAKEAENVPLIYRSGADVVVAPSIAGGRMLAMATKFDHAPRFMEDILTFGRGLDFGERIIEDSEAGISLERMGDMKDKLVIGAYHKGASYTYDQLSDLCFNPGDIVIFLSAKG